MELDHEHEHHHHQEDKDEETLARARAELKELFSQFKYPVPINLYTAQTGGEPWDPLARQALVAVRELTDKVTVEEFNLDGPEAKRDGVEHHPTLIFCDGDFRIRWLGAPVGEEMSSLVETLVILGYRVPGLSPQSEKVLDSISEPRHIRVFVSPTCPYCPQQTVNAVKAAAAKPELISLEIVDVQAVPELAEKYDAFSTPTTYANDQLIAKGSQPEELFMASLAKLEQQTVFIPDDDAPVIETDLVIVGGGPAGLTAGIYAARSGLKAVVVEKGTLGGQVATTPLVENYPGFTQVGGKALVDIMVNHALEYAHILPGEEVMEIKAGPPMMVSTNRRRLNTRAVLLATGARTRHLGVPGEEELAGRGVSYCSTCDGPLFKGRKVLMVGGGDSAVTEALHLHNVGADVTLVHRRDKLRAQAQLVKSLEQSGVEVLYNTELKEIIGRDRVRQVELHNSATGQTSTREVEGVFIAVGYDPAVELAQKTGVAVTKAGYIEKDERHRTSVPGIYSAGDVEGGYKQIVTAAGQGAEAAMAIFEDLVNPYWLQKRGRKAKAEN